MKTPNSLRTRDVHRLDRSILLSDKGAPLYTQAAVGLFVLILLAFVVWANIIEVDEVAKATGELVSSHPQHPVQHLYGGTVKKVTVQDGQVVSEGEALVLLDVGEINSQIAELQTQWELARLRAARLAAFVKSRKLLDLQTPLPNVHGIQDELLAQSLINLRASEAVNRQQIIQLEQEIEEEKLQQLNLEGQQEILTRDLKLHGERDMEALSLLQQEKDVLQEEMEIREDLVDLGLNSNIKFLAMRRQLLQLQKEIQEKELAFEEKSNLLDRQIQQAMVDLNTIPYTLLRKKSNIQELRDQLLEDRSKLITTALQERDRAVEQKLTLDERIKRLQDRLVKSQIKAPLSGTVNNLVEIGVGTVIEPGKLLCSIVPKEAELIAEVKIDNRDIGHLSIGQGARVKMTSFDFSRYGSLPGELSVLTAASRLDEMGTPYFMARIKLESLRPDDHRSPLPLRVGMSLDADIITGKKTVMEYLLKPIYASTLDALQER